MVSILKALKVSLLFLILGIVPLTVALLSLLAIISISMDLNASIVPAKGLNLGFLSLTGEPYLWIIVMVGALIVFFIGLFKAIGDITEAALIE